MRNYLVRLHSESEARRCLLDPVLNRCFFHKLAESEVHFNRIELSCVVAEKLFLREFGWVEVGLPARVGPSGSPHEQLRHSKVSKKSAADGIIPCASPYAPLAASRFPLRRAVEDALVLLPLELRSRWSPPALQQQMFRHASDPAGVVSIRAWERTGPPFFRPVLRLAALRTQAGSYLSS